MGRRLLPRGEDPGAFERDVDAERLVRKLGRILDRGHFDLVAVDDHRVALDLDLMRKAAVDAVETQEVSVGLDRTQIVDGDDLDVLAARLQNSAQHEPPDAAEAVDRNFGNHPHFSSRARSTGATSRQMRALNVRSSAQSPLPFDAGAFAARRAPAVQLSKAT